jgi:hypothetical protein
VPDEEISLCFGLVARMSVGLRDRVLCSGVVVERNDAGKEVVSRKDRGICNLWGIVLNDCSIDFRSLNGNL